MERTASLSKATQLYNFSVYKWSKGRTVQRLILQVLMHHVHRVSCECTGVVCSLISNQEHCPAFNMGQEQRK